MIFAGPQAALRCTFLEQKWSIWNFMCAVGIVNFFVTVHRDGMQLHFADETMCPLVACLYGHLLYYLSASVTTEIEKHMRIDLTLNPH